jgi:predicted amidophosphoribosyltransferase
MKVYSVCCIFCHAGWNRDTPGGICPRCGRDLQTRGTYVVIDIPKSPEIHAIK